MNVGELRGDARAASLRIEVPGAREALYELRMRSRMCRKAPPARTPRTLSRIMFSAMKLALPDLISLMPGSYSPPG